MEIISKRHRIQLQKRHGLKIRSYSDLGKAIDLVVYKSKDMEDCMATGGRT